MFGQNLGRKVGFKSRLLFFKGYLSMLAREMKEMYRPETRLPIFHKSVQATLGFLGQIMVHPSRSHTFIIIYHLILWLSFGCPTLLGTVILRLLVTDGNQKHVYRALRKSQNSQWINGTYFDIPNHILFCCFNFKSS